jgi:AraC-like DNA-binding protein
LTNTPRRSDRTATYTCHVAATDARDRKKGELFCRAVDSPTSQIVVDFESRDPDALADLLSRRFAPVKILPVDAAPLSAASGTYGGHAGIDFSRTRYTGDFTLVPQRLYDGVFFYLPVHGHMLVDQGREQLLGTTTKAIAAEGFAYRSMTFSGNFATRAVVISRPLLAERLSILLGRPIVEKPFFESVVNAGTPGLQALQALVEFATGSEFRPALNAGTLTVRRLHEMFLDMILEVWPHGYSNALHKSSSSIAPRHVKLVLDFITEQPNASATGAELAAISGVSLRSLQAGFRHFAGMSIAAYQRQVRLESAHNDLLRNPSVPIEDIALKWGFTNAGRFSRYFREAYGVSPFAVARKGAQR